MTNVNVFNAASALMSSALLFSYCIILTLRVSTGGAGHIGGDVIAGCYILAAIGLITSVLLYGLFQDSTSRSIRPWCLASAIIATLAWLGLHLCGFVYSHESMFGGKA